ncbi:hypothetical protein IWX64_003285 [Arthrobacter sp. CAN_A212]|uniref:hypothetical protein n=1 Tax=Arthrobacter sp. CAN_A212 TaxID=2787719 RepID=UPI0018C99111
MTGTTRQRIALDLSRSALTFLWFTAMIIGILAMHVWMGGHGSSTHGASAQGASAHGAVLSTSSMTADTEHATSLSGSHHVQANDVPAAPPGESAGELGQGCIGSCGNDGAALGMCLLAVIVVAALAFLVRSGQFVPGSVLLRGPPLIRLRPLSIPVPSLIQLCISRT